MVSKPLCTVYIHLTSPSAIILSHRLNFCLWRFLNEDAFLSISVRGIFGMQVYIVRVTVNGWHLALLNFIYVASQVEHNGVLFLKLLLCRHCSIVDLLAQLNCGCKSSCVQIPPSFCSTSMQATESWAGPG